MDKLKEKKIPVEVAKEIDRDLLSIGVKSDNDFNEPAKSSYSKEQINTLMSNDETNKPTPEKQS